MAGRFCMTVSVTFLLSISLVVRSDADDVTSGEAARKRNLEDKFCESSPNEDTTAEETNVNHLDSDTQRRGKAALPERIFTKRPLCGKRRYG